MFLFAAPWKDLVSPKMFKPSEHSIGGILYKTDIFSFKRPQKNMFWYHCNRFHKRPQELILFRTKGRKTTVKFFFELKLFKQYTHNITITLYKINPSKTQYIP